MKINKIKQLSCYAIVTKTTLPTNYANLLITIFTIAKTE